MLQVLLLTLLSFTYEMQIYEKETENKNEIFATFRIFFINFVVQKRIIKSLIKL